MKLLYSRSYWPICIFAAGTGWHSRSQSWSLALMCGFRLRPHSRPWMYYRRMAVCNRAPGWSQQELGARPSHRSKILRKEVSLQINPWEACCPSSYKRTNATWVCEKSEMPKTNDGFISMVLFWALALTCSKRMVFFFFFPPKSLFYEVAAQRSQKLWECDLGLVVNFVGDRWPKSIRKQNKKARNEWTNESNGQTKNTHNKILTQTSLPSWSCGYPCTLAQTAGGPTQGHKFSTTWKNAPHVWFLHFHQNVLFFSFYFRSSYSVPFEKICVKRATKFLPAKATIFNSFIITYRWRFFHQLERKCNKCNAFILGGMVNCWKKTIVERFLCLFLFFFSVFFCFFVFFWSRSCDFHIYRGFTS